MIANLARETVMADAVERPLRMESAQLVRELVDLFGAKLVAVMGRVKNTRTVRHWLEDAKKPDEIDRLRFALQVAYIIRTAGEDDAVIDAWFRGMNLRLGDRSPALVIADDVPETARANVMAAARAFTAQ